MPLSLTSRPRVVLFGDSLTQRGFEERQRQLTQGPSPQALVAAVFDKDPGQSRLLGLVACVRDALDAVQKDTLEQNGGNYEGYDGDFYDNGSGNNNNGMGGRGGMSPMNTTGMSPMAGGMGGDPFKQFNQQQQRNMQQQQQNNGLNSLNAFSGT